MIGSTISHYQVLEKLGAGGMGVVYKAEDTRLGRFVALKFLPENFADDPQLRNRFQREARAASALNHPNICTIYDIGEEDRRVFLAMEFLDGVTLKEMIGKGSLEVEQVIDIATQVLDGLEAAHADGIIHRDIKPANIFVTTKNRAKILDFGLAKMAMAKPVRTGEEETFSASNLHFMTTGGGVLGTMPYMSPEQALGKPLDTRSDLFSFGVSLYEMATGQMPFRGDTTGAVFLEIVQRTPAPPRQLNPTVPEDLQHIIDRCLEKDRELRYQSASDIRGDLKRLRRAPYTSSSGARGAPDEKSAGVGIQKAGSLSQADPSVLQPVLTDAALAKRSPSKVRAILATLLVALSVGGSFYWRSHRKATLTERDTVVLADFANNTGDGVFDEPLQTALMMDLNQSPFLNVLSESRVAATLKLMTRPARTQR